MPLFKRCNAPWHQLVVSAPGKPNRIKNILDPAYFPLKPHHSPSPALHIASMCTVLTDPSGSLGARPIWQAGALTPKVLKEKPATTCGEMDPMSDTQLSWGALLRGHWAQQPGTQLWAYPGGLEFSFKWLNVTAPSLHADTLTWLIPAQGYCTTEAQYSGNLSMPLYLPAVLPVPALTRC